MMLPRFESITTWKEEVRDMKKLNLLLAAVLTTALAFSGCNNPPSQTNQAASLRFDWIANMNFIGDVYAMKEVAQKNGLSLNCEQAGFGVDPVKMVVSGANDFGIVSLEQLYMANEKGADLVAIGVINDVSPAVFLAKSDKKFDEPKDLENKSVGINPGGATEYVYRSFVKANNLDKSKIKEIPVDYDIKTFINGQYDVRLAFAFIEPLDLKLANVSYSMIDPVKFGLKFPGRVYFTKRETIEKRPRLVQTFINTVADGWELALKNKSKSIDLLAEYEPKVDKKRETESLDLGERYFVGYNNKVLTFDKQNILNSANMLVDIGLIKSTDFGRVLDSTFIDNYHKSQGR
jgi:ABC-type nitrate/sulfonate/bicarbonate transport system substrate-binding protein